MCRKLRSVQITTPRQYKWEATHFILSCLPTQVRRVHLTLRLDNSYVYEEDNARLMDRAVRFNWQRLQADLTPYVELETLILSFEATTTAKPLIIADHPDVQDAIQDRLGNHLRSLLCFV
jgi:hypothetical protein